MLFTTTTQWVALFLVLVGGWLLGLASHPGGRRWRERYAAERDAHAVTRREAETRLAEADARAAAPNAEADARLAEAHARIAELERDHARLAAAAPLTAATVTPVTNIRPTAVLSAAPGPAPAYPVRVTPETDGPTRKI